MSKFQRYKSPHHLVLLARGASNRFYKSSVVSSDRVTSLLKEL